MSLLNSLIDFLSEAFFYFNGPPIPVPFLH
jgi:hypothetical protein